jgi:hypothetical protein
MAGRGYEVRFNVVDTTNFDQFEPIFEEEMGPAVTLIGNKVLGDAQRLAQVDQGFFRGSMQLLVERPAPVTISANVVATAPYSMILEGVDEEGNETEYGRRPGGKFPPLDQLRLWVERVISPPEKELDDVTFLVGRAIVRRGIKPQRPIGTAFRNNLEFIDEQIQAGLDRTLNRL